jgi:C-terminal processing protease CtpA/Prc
LVERESQSRAPIAPKGPRYKGKVFVLISAANSSATFQFANLIKANQLGHLIGEATGGNQRGINGGAFFFMTLPHSKLVVDIPLIGTFPPTRMPDAGVAPDVVVVDTQADIAVGRDAAMLRALALAKS